VARQAPYDTHFMDTLEFSTSGRRWQAELHCPFDLAITMEFDGPQPRFFASSGAVAVPLRAGAFTGDVAAGASCMCGVHTLAPHCHGTHTECVGHLTGDGTHVAALTPIPPALAAVVTVRPGPLGLISHDRPRLIAATDLVITRAMLAAAAAAWAGDPWTALVVRTMPNEPAKTHRHYEGPCPAPYFTADAMNWIVERGVTSLVVDLPSLDRAEDGGGLIAHHVYWGLAPGVRDAQLARRGHALVTELAYVPATAADGLYLLDLQVPAFGADAAPSRPVIYPLLELAP
jgi:arylformamidase